MNLKSKKDIVFIVLTAFFVCNAVIAELIGGKLICFFGTFTQSIGILLWPVVFLITDLVNEYFGKEGVKKLTLVTMGIIAYAFITLLVCMQFQAIPGSPVDDRHFNTVFGQSMYIIIGSIVAFGVSQLVDSGIFWMLRSKTGKGHIWLRATGSTIISQLLDTFIVQFIAFVVPGVWTISTWLHNAGWGYAFKLLVAICLIPFIYLGHFLIDKFLGDKTSKQLIQHSAEQTLQHPVHE